MANVLIQLKENKNFSHNEKIVADYILNHLEEILNLSSKEISDACFVSTATIYRLCDKLNLSGLSDLKLKISIDLDDYLTKSDEFNYDFPIKQYQTHHEIINILKEDYEKTLVLTANLFNLEKLKRIVHAMKKAKQIDIYTSSANVFFAENFKFQMQEIGVHVNVPIEEYHQRLLAAYSDESHIAIVLTYEGRGSLVSKIPQILNEKKTPILLISSYEYHNEDFDFDYQLYINPYENHYKKISSFSTRMSILYILDVLYTCYFSLNYDENLSKKLDYYRLVAQYDK